MWMIYVAIAVDLTTDGIRLGAGSAVFSSLATVLARIMHQGAHAFRARWRRGSGCPGFEVAVSGRAEATAGAVVRLAPCAAVAQ